MQWRIGKPFNVKFVGFSTTTSGPGEFKIWRKDHNGATYSGTVKICMISHKGDKKTQMFKNPKD